MQSYDDFCPTPNLEAAIDRFPLIITPETKNWGQGIGIITQTSLLRIFDPMEMYGVIQTLQETIEELKQEKAKLLAIIDRQ